MNVVNDLRNVLRLVKPNRRPFSACPRSRLDYASRLRLGLLRPRLVQGKGLRQIPDEPSVGPSVSDE